VYKSTNNPTMDCPDVSGELLIVFKCSVLSFGTEIKFHHE
jgi:hypothetical protein